MSDGCRVCLLLAALLVGSPRPAAPCRADEPPTSAPGGSAAAEDDSFYSERDALWEEATALAEQGRHAAAAAVGERMLAVEIELLGDSDSEVILSHEWLAGQHALADDWPAAIEQRRKAFAAHKRLRGKRDWRTRDARRAIDDTERLAGMSPADRRRLDVADAQTDEGERLRQAGEFAAAIAATEKALQTRRRLLGDDHPQTTVCLNNLGWTRKQQGDYDAAKRLLEETLERRRRVLGVGHPWFASSLANLASLHEAQGDYDAALPLYERALRVRRRALGTADPAYTTSLTQLGWLHKRRGEFDLARPLLEQALEIREEILGRQHAWYLGSLRNLAELHTARRVYPRAIDYLRQALAVREETLGAEHPDAIADLVMIGGLHHALVEYDAAEGCFRRALELRQQSVGENHPDYAECLNLVGVVLRSRGDFPAAMQFFKKAMRVYEQAVGERNKDYLTCLANVGEVYSEMGDYPRALEHQQRAADLRREVLGEENLSYGTSLNNVGILKLKQGDYAGGLAAIEQSAEVFRKLFGTEHPRYATALSNVGYAQAVLGDYSAAGASHRRALEIRRKTVGEEHPEYATSLAMLGDMHRTRGAYAEATRCLQQAVEIRRASLGERHPDYAVGLNDLAEVYSTRGDYARALPLYEQALAIRREALGDRHPDTTTTLNDLANLCNRLGDAARALALHRQVLEVRLEVLGEGHPWVALSRSNLASDYSRIGKHAEALRLYQQAYETRLDLFGAGHPVVAASLNNLAAIHQSRGDYPRAIELFGQALALREKIFGRRHPLYADTLGRLGRLYTDTGDFERALDFCSRAAAIRRATLGEDHPKYATSLNNLARLHQSRGDLDRALAVRAGALGVVLSHLDRTAAAQTERQQLALGQSLAYQLDAYLSCLLEADGPADEAFAAVLGWKGATLVRQRAARLAAEQPELAPLFAELQAVTRRWAALAQRGPGADAEGWQARLAELTAEKNRLEVELSARSSVYRTLTERVTPDRLRAALPAGVVLVDYLVFNRWRVTETPPRAGLGIRVEESDAGLLVKAVSPGGAADRDGRLEPGDVITAVAQGDEAPQPLAGLSLVERMMRLAGAPDSTVHLRVQRPAATDGGRPGAAEEVVYQMRRGLLENQSRFLWTPTPSLLALVVGPGQPTRVFDLGPMRPVSEAIDAWRETFGMSAEGVRAGAELRRKVWAPLFEAVADAETVLVSPDGALGRLPLAALPGREPGTYLLEDHRLAMAPVPQLIPAMVEDAGRRQLEKDLLLMGGVDYDRRNDPRDDSAAPAKRRRRFTRGALDEVTDEKQWEPLPGSAAEVAFIADLYRRLYEQADATVVDLRANEATEEAFRNQAPRCAVLHLATHGFFANAAKRSALGGALRGERTNRLGEDDREAVRGFSPGLLSGLVFAGANNPPEAGGATDDGLLTSSEIAFLPLGGVRLVVLSACNTGLGEVAGGEGLLGVQRALQVSGAGATVASLWQIDDAATRRLMERFYEGYLDKELSPLDALRDAQLWAIRNPDKLRGGDLPEEETEAPRLSPRYWAAFSLSGDWR